MPQLGESVTEGTIARWLKAEGDEIEKDEPLCEVDTDKVSTELPSPFAGKVEKLLIAEGTTVDVGVEIALVTAEGDLEDEPSPEEAPAREDAAAELQQRSFRQRERRPSRPQKTAKGGTRSPGRTPVRALTVTDTGRSRARIICVLRAPHRWSAGSPQSMT